jgi:beta-glucanase (GH16 family)
MEPSAPRSILSVATGAGILAASLMVVFTPGARSTHAVAVNTVLAASDTDATGRPEANPGDVLVWADEFDRDGRPDPANWTYETGFVRNNELQWYQPDNARVEKGMLVIEGRRERKVNPDYQPGSTDWRRGREFAEYTASSLTTRGLHAWQYGRFEMRARIDTRAGLWPAFWTLGVAGGWPRCGEVDIMEYYAGVLLANAAWGSAQRGRAVWDDSRAPLRSLGDPGWPDRFHVWRMNWDERQIRIFVDGRLLNEVDLERTVNEDGTGTNPFHQPHYLLVNLAIGGTQGGDPSATKFPAKYEIDYIRVYQKAGSLPEPLLK